MNQPSQGAIAAEPHPEYVHPPPHHPLPGPGTLPPPRRSVSITFSILVICLVGGIVVFVCTCLWMYCKRAPGSLYRRIFLRETPETARALRDARRARRRRAHRTSNERRRQSIARRVIAALPRDVYGREASPGDESTVRSAYSKPSNSASDPGTDDSIIADGDVEQGLGAAAVCPVCIDPLVPGQEISRLPCGDGLHVLHLACLRMWVEAAAHPQCPVCRFDLTALVPPAPAVRPEAQQDAGGT